jgi:hypothetical protein
MKTQKQKQKKAGGKFKMCEERSESAFVPSLSLPAHPNKKRKCAEIKKTNKSIRFAPVPRL